MNTPRDRKLRQPRDGVRMDARLDPATRAKLESLSASFHRSRAAVLREVMQWGLSRGPLGQIDRNDTQGPVQHLFFFVEPELHQRVGEAARGAGMDVAPWLRHLLHQIRRKDFPASWQRGTQHVPAIDRAGRAARRSHDSRDYDERFMLRRDRRSSRKLQALAEHFTTSRAEIIRQLIAQASPETFPESWRLAAEEGRARRGV
jgi:predicted transcriptional regulator